MSLSRLADGGPAAPARELGVEALEVAILDRNRTLPRKFRRLRGERLAEVLRGRGEGEDAGHETPAQLAAEPVPETVLPTSAVPQLAHGVGAASGAAYVVAPTRSSP